MIWNLKLAIIDYKYCDYLRKFDNKIPYNKGNKELRPFVGILFKIENLEYFAPLSSPKEKHLKMKNTIDFYKINNGKLGAINFNNMLPVFESNYKVINLKDNNCSIKDKKYNSLLNDQLTWLNERYQEIKSRSQKLYYLYNNDKLSKNIKKRCCNFKLLEEKGKEYNFLNVR